MGLKKLPKKLVLLGVPVSIGFKKNLKTSSDEPADGLFFPSQDFIYLNSNLSLENQKLALIHELIHFRNKLFSYHSTSSLKYKINCETVVELESRFWEQLFNQLNEKLKK